MKDLKLDRMFRWQSDAPQPETSACCLGVAVVNIYKGGQLHHCPLEACVCMAVHGPIAVSPLNSSSVPIWPLCPDLSSGPTEWMDATPPSAGRRSLMKTASLGSITAARSFMKTTVCCQGIGITLSDCRLSLRNNLMCSCTLLRIGNTCKEQEM